MRVWCGLVLAALVACSAPEAPSAPAPGPAPTSGQALAYRFTASDGVDYYVFLNPSARAQTFVVDRSLARGEVVVDRTRAGTQALADPEGIRIEGARVRLEGESSAVVRWRP